MKEQLFNKAPIYYKLIDRNEFCVRQTLPLQLIYHKITIIQ